MTKVALLISLDFVMIYLFSIEADYNALPKENCTRSCGNIIIPFPFGVEEGCCARKQFYLNCTNVTTSTLQLAKDPNYLLTFHQKKFIW